MAKKKASKKEARKAASKRKTAKKKTTPRKKAAARKRTAARTAKKTTRRPAAKRKTAKRAAPRIQPAKLPSIPMPFEVVVQQCDIQPPRQNFPPFWTVHFRCTLACTVVFSNPSVFGLPSPEQPMKQGDNAFPIQVVAGSTSFWIKGCAEKVGPAEIIVP